MTTATSMEALKRLKKANKPYGLLLERKPVLLLVLLEGAELVLLMVVRGCGDRDGVELQWFRGCGVMEEGRNVGW